MNGTPLADKLRSFYRGLSATVVFGGIPMFVLGLGFAGGFGGGLNSFRMGLAEFSPLNLLIVLPLLLLPIYWWLGRSGPSITKIGWRVVVAAACAFGAFLLIAQIKDTPVEEWDIACHRGAYRLEDGRVMAVSASPVAALMVYLSDGTRLMTWGGENSFSGTSCIGGNNGVRDDFSMEAASCPANKLRVKTHDAPMQSASRIGVHTLVADFTSARVDFKARLFLPTGGKSVPLLLLPAARDGWSRLDWDHAPYLASGLGVAVFVYDKPGEWPGGRGKVGTDEEALTHAVAALAKAKASAGWRVSQVGFLGGEDALLAAYGTNADFAVVDAEKLPTRLLQGNRMPVLWLLPSQGDRRAEAVAQDDIRRLGLGDHVKLVVMPGADEHLAFYEQRGSERCSIDSPPDYWPTVLRWLGALPQNSRPEAP